MSIGVKLTSTVSSYILFFVFLLSTFFLLVDGVLAQSVPSLEFSATSKIVKVGEDFSTYIVVDTVGQAAHGTGVKINFDPEVLELTSIEAGNIFGDYPVVSFDNNEGKIIVSAISSSVQNAFVGRGVFATLNFKAIKKGGTAIEFDFEPGSTSDSNIAVVTGNGDILKQVNSLLVTITETTGTGGTVSVPTTPQEAVEPEEGVGLFSKLFRFLGIGGEKAIVRQGRPKSQAIDAQAPIPSQQPITDANQNQPESIVGYGRSNISRIIFFVLVVFTVILAVYLARRYINSKKG